ncbi:MAG: (Fe-S)-binding protein [Syntrophobacteraceae bacterium]|nr:(Fe-S)-binding protein [Syntrophobacteraceae bacterium]
MLIGDYTTEFVRISCGSETGAPDLVIHLDRDISEVIPYLNTVFEGFQYTKEPRSVSFRLGDGKLVVVHPRKICVSAPGDKSEGEKIIEGLLEKINDTWERRGEIEPRTGSAASPQVLEILRLLPRTNCGLCGEPTCMVFASQAAKGRKTPEECPPLEGGEKKSKLAEYLARFDFGPEKK